MAKKKATTKKCYIVKSGARWVAHSMASKKRLGSSTKSRNALKLTMEGKGWSCVPASKNPKTKAKTKLRQRRPREPRKVVVARHGIKRSYRTANKGL